MKKTAKGNSRTFANMAKDEVVSMVITEDVKETEENPFNLEVIEEPGLENKRLIELENMLCDLLGKVESLENENLKLKENRKVFSVEEVKVLLTRKSEILKFLDRFYEVRLQLINLDLDLSNIETQHIKVNFLTADNKLFSISNPFIIMQMRDFTVCKIDERIEALENELKFIDL